MTGQIPGKARQNGAAQEFQRHHDHGEDADPARMTGGEAHIERSRRAPEQREAGRQHDQRRPDQPGVILGADQEGVGDPAGAGQECAAGEPEAADETAAKRTLSRFGVIQRQHERA